MWVKNGNGRRGKTYKREALQRKVNKNKKYLLLKFKKNEWLRRNKRKWHRSGTCFIVTMATIIIIIIITTTARATIHTSIELIYYGQECRLYNQMTSFHWYSKLNVFVEPFWCIVNKLNISLYNGKMEDSKKRNSPHL